MKKRLLLQDQRGFTLVQAVFILVVLALLGVTMMRLSRGQSATNLFALQGARAYQAARSGLEWGAARAAAGADCNGNMTVGVFQVNVTCNIQPFTEGAIGPYNVYWISATADYGTYGSPDFVQRSAEMKVGL